MSSSKQDRVQLELNDLEPRLDPKGGTHHPIAGRADSIQIDSFFDISYEVPIRAK
jgi:hypothetical protein